jgi:hypothetical protein
MKGRMYLMVDDGELVLQAFVVREGKHLHCYSYTPDETDLVIERIIDHSLRADYPLSTKIAANILLAMEDFQHQHSEGTWLR